MDRRRATMNLHELTKSLNQKLSETRLSLRR